MLQTLRNLLKKHGRLSHEIVRRSPRAPSITTYCRHFGNLYAAYQLIGYDPPHWAGLGKHHPYWSDDELIEGIRSVYAEHGYLSNALIEESSLVPSAYYMRKRFGTLNGALAAAGLQQMTHSELVLAAHQRIRKRLAQHLGSSCLRPDGTLPTPRFSSETILSGLARLLDANGYLSAKLIDADMDLPSAAAVQARYGSLLVAYEAVGWKRTKRQLQTEMYARRDPKHRPKLRTSRTQAGS